MKNKSYTIIRKVEGDKIFSIQTVQDNLVLFVQERIKKNLEITLHLNLKKDRMNVFELFQKFNELTKMPDLTLMGSIELPGSENLSLWLSHHYGVCLLKTNDCNEVIEFLNEEIEDEDVIALKFEQAKQAGEDSTVERRLKPVANLKEQFELFAA
jgi:hypothetical protein